VIERVHVNATTPAGLELEFDVTLPRVSCALLNVDANDPTGQRQSLHLDKRHHVWKHRISKTGELIGDKTRIELGSTLLSEEKLRERALEAGALEESDMKEVSEEEECGSCWGAGEDGECCNTCDDVKRVYARRSWVLPSLDNITQCQHELSSTLEDGEGCNVHGIVALSTGGGNLHLAPGHDLEEFGSGKQVSILDVFMRTFEQFNVSHTIHKLRFGAEYPGTVNQLDGEVRHIEDGFGMYQYYFQVSIMLLGGDCCKTASHTFSPLATGRSDSVSILEWHYYSDESVQCDGTHAACDSWLEPRTAGSLFFL